MYSLLSYLPTFKNMSSYLIYFLDYLFIITDVYEFICKIFR